MVTYISPLSTTLFTVSEVISVTRLEINEIFMDRGEEHDFWEAVYVENGEILEFSGDERFRIKTGEIFFHKPFDYHKTDGVSSKSSIVYYISFKCNSQNMEMLANEKIIVPIEMYATISRLYTEFRANVIMKYSGDVLIPTMIDDAPVGGMQLARVYLEILLKEAFRIKSQTNIIFHDKDEYYKSIIEQIDKYLEQNIYENISLVDICESLHFSKTFLCKLYKDTVGNTIKHRYNELKINEAKKLLITTNYTASKIASKLKFSDQYYFSHVFKRFSGCTPTEYRNSNVK